jgi:hypothetical protein
LQDFFKNHPQNNDPEKLLIDLQVKPIDSGSKASILRLAGTLGERRHELITKASSPVIQNKLLKGADEELIVSIRFGKKGALYDYPLGALKPLITAQTSYLFDVKYGDLLKHTKLFYTHRQKLFDGFTGDINYRLEGFLILSDLTIDSENYCNLFIPFKHQLENTNLMFGNSVTSIKKKSLKGLQKGGVFKRHPDFQDVSQKIRLGIIKPHNLKVGDFREKLQNQLKSYEFDSLLPKECGKNYNIDDLEGPDSRAKLEELINELLEQPIDLVLAFLPGSEEKDDDNDNELYELVKKHLLRRNTASQIIYEDTIAEIDFSKNSDILKLNNILNNITPGILGKLGNLPFVLAEPLEIAEAFVGLDISRFSYGNRSGSRNVCASVRLYGRHGEFIRYRLDDSLIEGEEIPRQVLEDFFPSHEFKGNKVLVYRDGPFRGDEVEHLLARAKAIKSRFILVESIKSGVPRLYNLYNGKLSQPTRGLALKISDREVILVTTNVPEKIGVPRPLRLRIHEDGEQTSLEQLIEATLKLTLLHYGSLKDPRLPIPLYASDAIAYRRLQGIYPTNPEGDRQFWL